MPCISLWRTWTQASPWFAKAYEYLQKRTGAPGDSTGNEMLWAFEIMRDKVEAAVSSLYDAGKAPFVRSEN
jgi:hypothetical protein